MAPCSSICRDLFLSEPRKTACIRSGQERLLHSHPQALASYSHVVAIVELCKLVELVKLCLGVKLRILSAMGKKGVEIIEQVPMPVSDTA